MEDVNVKDSKKRATLAELFLMVGRRLDDTVGFTFEELLVCSAVGLAVIDDIPCTISHIAKMTNFSRQKSKALVTNLIRANFLQSAGTKPYKTYVRSDDPIA